VFLEEGTSNELRSDRSVSISGEVHNPVILQAAEGNREEFLQAWSHMHVHGHQFRLVIIPDWMEVHTLAEAFAHITNVEEISFRSVLDIVTRIPALASRVSGSTVMSSLSTVSDVVNIETWATTAAAETWNTAKLGISVNSLTISTGESPLVGAAALGFGDSVESLLTDFVTLFHVDNSVSSWAAAGSEERAAALLAFFTTGVIIDHDDLFHLGKLA